MKTNLYFKQTKIYLKILLHIFIINIFFSCDNNDFLKEVPLDFYSPETSYVNFEDYEAAIYNLYQVFRSEFYNERKYYLHPRVSYNCTDMCDNDADDLSNWQNLLNPQSDFVADAFWKPCYRIIYDSNVIINRSESDFSKLTDSQKKVIQAEARFFRGYCYKMLADIYGGVPIILEETSSPKRDYVRASRDDVYLQSAEDLDFAAKNLKNITETDDSRVSSLTAFHALAEAYLCLKDYDNAIEAASETINDPATALMTQRFGTRVNDEPVPGIPWANGGDPYWDLFRKGNQNRSSGNTEALWVIQYSRNVTGGFDDSDSNGGFRYEMSLNPRIWRLKLIDGTTLLPSANTYYGGQGAGQVRASLYARNIIWERSGWNEDIRNSDYNIIRDVIVANPNSQYYGKWIIKDKLVNLKSELDTLRDFYPFFAKMSNMGDHPEDLWIDDQTTPGSLLMAGGPTNTKYSNIYRIRLAETYLIRAEAYIGKNDNVNAAKDINVVRCRSQAPEVLPEDVDIDYILDERARELAFEENRLQTLSRLGKLVERQHLYNNAFKFYDHQNLWPIPYSEIQKNTGAELIQNPGY